MAMKNKASETINKITPKFNPFCTAAVWSPKKVKIYKYITILFGLYINQ